MGRWSVFGGWWSFHSWIGEGLVGVSVVGGRLLVVGDLSVVNGYLFYFLYLIR